MRGRRLRDAYRDTFSSPQGQTVLADLMHFCCLLRPTKHPSDPYMTAYAEGARSVGLHIIGNVDYDEVRIRELEKKRKQRMSEDEMQ